MQLIKKFQELGKNDADIAGGKGASLGEMTQAGIPVPPGFVVLSSSFEQFIEQTDLNVEIDAILDTVKHEEIHTVEHASEKIQGLILNSDMPENIQSEILNHYKELGAEYVAVRSSATAEDSSEAAWAGQLDSFLNTTEATLLQNVRRCWASLFTPRAIFYRFEKELHKQKISVAVVVQKMVNSEKSGIAFSVHPVTEDRNQLIIEAGFGLGEAIVSGSVTPDSYVVTKEPREIIDINVSSQGRALYRVEGGGNEWKDLGAQGDEQVLTETQVKELSTLIIKIENHYGFPCDIEWAFEVETFYITQSRPITTLMIEEEDANVEGIIPSEYKFYGLWKGNLFANWFWTNWLTPEYLERIKLDLKDGGVFVIKGGNFFLKNSTVQTIQDYIESLVAHKDISPFQEMRKISDEIFSQSITEIKAMDPNIVTPDIIRNVSEIGRKIMFPWTFGYTVMKIFDELLTAAAEKSGFPVEKIAALMPEFDTPLMESQKKLREIKISLKEKGYWDKLLENLETAVSDIQSDSVVSSQIDNYSENYSWVGIMNLIGERLTTEQVLEQVSHLADKQYEKQESIEVDDNMKFLVEAAAIAGYMPQLGVEYYAIYSQFAMVFYKNVAKELGITYKEFLNLNLDEIEAGLNGADVKNIIAKRQDDNWAIFTVPGVEPKVIDNKELVELLVDKMVPKVEISDNGSIIGQVGNKGVAQGRVKVILTPEEFSKMEAGDVLVTTMTTPDYVPLMHKASAIVTDIGGMLCHAAIISRELNKSCVIGTKFASQILKDGDMVEVDANNGLVRILNPSNDELLAQKYINELAGAKSFPPLNNYSLFIFGSGYNTEKYFKGVYKKESIYTCLNIRYQGQTQTYLAEDALKNYSTEAFENFLNNPSYMARVEENFYKNFSAMDDLYNKYTYQFVAGQDEKDLLPIIEKSYDLFWTTNAWSHFSVYFDLDLCFSTVEKVYPNMSKSELESIWHNATDMVSESFDKSQKRDILEYLQDNPAVSTDDLAQHCHYFFASYKNVLPLDTVKEEVYKIYGDFIENPNKVSSELETMDEELRDKQENLKAWRDGLTDIQKRVVDFCQIVMRVRDHRKNHFAKGIVVAWRIAEKVFDNAKVDKSLIENILPFEELMKGSSYVASINTGLQQRVNNYVVHVPYSGSKEISYEKVKENHDLINSYFIEDHKDQTGIIKGQVGNKGSAKGIVKIVKSSDEFGKFKEAEILVTGMTRPEFVPLMRIAKAIITDEGGITCHAAIVSRELNVPCVIGTKVATRLLNDGDLVEVDADNGIIKLLNV
jgi:phosphoenolpyruvate synthase/pyruvate phosphate dikinase